jgi:hypothetical protein
MSEEFSCDLNGFKRQIASFCHKAESGKWSPEALDLGWRSVLLHYLNMQGSEADRIIAVSYLEYGNRRYVEFF